MNQKPSWIKGCLPPMVVFHGNVRNCSLVIYNVLLNVPIYSSHKAKLFIGKQTSAFSSMLRHWSGPECVGRHLFGWAICPVDICPGKDRCLGGHMSSHHQLQGATMTGLSNPPCHCSTSQLVIPPPLLLWHPPLLPLHN